MNRLFGWWLSHPGRCLLIPLMVGAVFQETSRTFSYACFGLAFASATQGLRVLWRYSRVLGVLAGIGFPTYRTLIALPAGVDPLLFLFWLPPVLALAIEHRVRTVRRSQGLPEVEPRKAPRFDPKKKSPWGGVYSAGLVLLGLFAVYFVMTLQAPRAAALAFKQSLHVGMSVSEVTVASLATPRHLVFVRSAAGAPEWMAYGSTVNLGGERAEGAVAVRALLERRAAELKVESMSFMFLTTIPVHSSILVHYGSDGRVDRIQGPVDRAE